MSVQFRSFIHVVLTDTPKLSSREWSIIFEDRELKLNITTNFFMGPDSGYHIRESSYQLCYNSYLTIFVVSSSYPLP